MASTKAPLFGFDASGSLGGAIVYSNWRGRNYVRVLATPSNPNSGGQRSTRSMMKFLSQIWAGLSAANKATWDALAAQGNYSNFNAFVRRDMDRWTQFTDPLRTPAEAAGTIPVLGALSLTAGVRQATVSQVITTANDGWGLLIARSLTTGFTPGKTDIVYVAPWSATPIVAIDTPLAAGTYYYRTAGFTYGGSRTAFVAQQSVVIT